MADRAKFQRDYILQIQSNRDPDQFFYLKPPLTLHFDISRSTLTSANFARLSVINLAPDTRAAIFHDRMRITANDYQKMALYAGYETTEKNLVFLGNVFEATSQKNGTDWRTDMNGFDGGVGLLSGHIALTTPAGWTMEQVLKKLTGAMDFVSFGAVGNMVVKNSRAVSMSGAPWEIFQRLVGDGLAFCDNGNVYALMENEYLVKPGMEEYVYGPDNIIGSPRRGDATVEVDVVFEPGVFIGMPISLRSLEPVYNGRYQLRAIRHRGTISGAVGENAITTLTLFKNKTMRPVYLK